MSVIPTMEAVIIPVSMKLAVITVSVILDSSWMMMIMDAQVREQGGMNNIENTFLV